MNPAYDRFGVTVYAGDCLEVLAELPAASVHAVTTDPPYGIGFMGRAWDQPGPYGSTRGDGRPRPAHPRDRAAGKDSTAATAGYDLSLSAMQSFQAWCTAWATECLRVLKPGDGCVPGCPVRELDEQSGVRRAGERPANRDGIGFHGGAAGTTSERVVLDSGGASRFFPVFRFEAKAPPAERPRVDGVAHPTVKPLALMRWLVRLVTPPGGVVLDPFLGSGTTAHAARAEGFGCIGIEREGTYLPLIRARLDGESDDLFGGVA